MKTKKEDAKADEKPDAVTEKLDTVKARGTDDAPIHLEPTSSPQGSLTAPRPHDGTAGGTNALLNPETGGVQHTTETGDLGPAGANISGTDLPLQAS